jgi:Flp pilus assembly protein TadD
MSTKTAKEWIDEGDKLLDDKEFEEAIECYDQTLKINSKDDYAWYSKGVALHSLERDQEAIECYDQALEINPKDDYAWNQKGLALYSLKRYEEAIECYDKALKINPKIDTVWNNKGVALYLLKRYEEAIECIDRSLEINPKDDLVWFFKGVSFAKLIQFKESAKSFNEAGISIWNIYTIPNKELTEDDKNSIAGHLVLYDPFFKQVMKQYSPSKEKRKTYQEIFRVSCKILDSILVPYEDREGIAHYTQKKTFETLLLNDKKQPSGIILKENPKFHLHAITMSNDLSEGRTLLDFLYGQPMPKIESDVIALAGSFTFNPDCLNQFRLYGKDNTQEGAGVSIILHDDFFRIRIQPISAKLSFGQRAGADLPIPEILGKEEEEKLTLFRCLYVDPETQQVISLGQREEYMFYRDKRKEFEEIKDEAERAKKIEEIKKEITKYNKKIKRRLDRVRQSMEDLRKLTKENDLSPAIVSDLLTDLRTLTKHVAFREEQECRIVRAMSLSEPKDKEEIRYYPDSTRPYTEYLPLADHVQEVRFGPQFENSEYYTARMKLEWGDKISCTQSTHPLVCR